LIYINHSECSVRYWSYTTLRDMQAESTDAVLHD
jgi:hypothetical protein